MHAELSAQQGDFIMAMVVLLRMIAKKIMMIAMMAIEARDVYEWKIPVMTMLIQLCC